MSPPAIRNPFFHVGFIVPDVDAAMEEFQVALGIEWRAPMDAIVPFLGPDGVYVELFGTATPRHADLLLKPSGERTNDEHH